MMTEITKDQAAALAALVGQLRPDWDTRGILSKLSESRARGAAWDIAHAALYAAEDQTNRTPAVIPLAGPHWTRGRALGQTSSTTPADMPGDHRCPAHDWERAHNCRACRSEQLAADDNERRQVENLTRQGVPRERVRQILAAAGMPDAPTTPDARTRAAGDTA